MIGGRLRASTVPTQFRQASSPHKSSKNQPAWRYSSGELRLPHRRKKDTKSEHWLTLLTVRPPNRPLATPRGYRSRDNAQARRRGASVRCPDPRRHWTPAWKGVARFDQRTVDPVARTLRIGPTSIRTDDSNRRRLRVGDKAGLRPRTAGTRTLSRATSRSERSSAASWPNAIGAHFSALKGDQVMANDVLKFVVVCERWRPRAPPGLTRITAVLENAGAR